MVLTERFCCVPSSAKTHRVVWTRLSVVVSIQAAALCLQEWVFVFCAGGDWGYTRSQLPGWHWHWWHRFLQLPLSPGHKSVFFFLTCFVSTLVYMHWLRFQTYFVTPTQVSGGVSYWFLHLCTCAGWGFKLLSPGHQSVFFLCVFFVSYFSNFLCQLATSHRFLVLISTLVHMQR